VNGLATGIQAIVLLQLLLFNVRVNAFYPKALLDEINWPALRGQRLEHVPRSINKWLPLPVRAQPRGFVHGHRAYWTFFIACGTAGSLYQRVHRSQFGMQVVGGKIHAGLNDLRSHKDHVCLRGLRTEVVRQLRLNIPSIFRVIPGSGVKSDIRQDSRGRRASILAKI
jgi:hypothetical protein